ncbi:MAG TPA: ABC transporter permease [candidate division Zixibacteria bacterium]|nr:ABC transporter permease [candidate division Zixibacteria bacterium]HER00140.1 ABC transporter permease [candidate division Zixibacteria bacterium]
MLNIKLVFKMFWREFKAQKKRMFLTILGIVWGTMSITMLLAFGDGLRNQLDINQKGMGEGIMIVWGGQTSMPYKGLPRGRPIRFEKDVVEFLKERIPQIEMIGGEYTRWGQSVANKSKMFNRMVNGVYPDYEIMRNMIPEMGGRFINQLDMDLKRRVVFLGNELADDLFGANIPREEIVGQTIEINGMKFTVIGVLKKKMQMGMYSGPDWNRAVIPATTFHGIYGHRYFNNLVVKPRDLSKTEFVEKRIIEELSGKYKFDPADESTIGVWNFIENVKTFNNVMLGMQIFFGLIGGLTLLVAGVGVANIMYVAVKERTTEIGVKMALGAKRFQVMAQFMLEALLIAFIGGGLGILFSVVITRILGSIDINNEALLWLGKPNISTTIAIITASILGIIGLVSGFFPSRKAASVNPVESLRYE